MGENQPHRGPAPGGGKPVKALPAPGNGGWATHRTFQGLLQQCGSPFLSHPFLPMGIVWQWEVACMELLLEGAVVVLAVLGLVEAVRMLVFWLLRPQSPGKGVLVVVPENGEDCEQLIRAGIARLKWMDWPGGRLLCLPREEDPQAQAICKILERRYPQLSLCKRDDLVYHIMDEEI